MEGVLGVEGVGEISRSFLDIKKEKENLSRNDLFGGDKISTYSQIFPLSYKNSLCFPPFRPFPSYSTSNVGNFPNPPAASLNSNGAGPLFPVRGENFTSYGIWRISRCQAVRMLREAWRKWRVNFLGRGVEEDIFLVDWLMRCIEGEWMGIYLLEEREMGIR